MSKIFAVFTSNPNLVRCDLHRLQAEVSLKGPRPSNSVGLGTVAQDVVLLERLGTDAALPSLENLAGASGVDALLLHAQSLPLGMSPEENTQPFRARGWLFAHQGSVEGFAQFRGRLLSSLPPALQRQIRGESGSEAAFALFLKELKGKSRSEDPYEDSVVVARALGTVVRTLEQLAGEAGVLGKSTLNLVATNGRVMAAAHHGPMPLSYALLEGTDRCERCGLEGSGPAIQPLIQEHRARRTVAIASDLSGGNGWQALASGSALAVDRGLNVQTVSF